MSRTPFRIHQPPACPLVAASILSADFGHLADECRDVLEQGADLLHLDVMDGHFVPNLTMGQDVIRALRRHLPEAFLDVHLMVQHPGDFIDSFAEAGADLFTFHVEVCNPLNPDGHHDAGDLIDRIHAAGMHAGVAVNPPMPIVALEEALEPYLSQLDLVLVMSVNPGRAGQSFIPDVLTKAEWVKERLGPRTRLQMDGGLNPRTASRAVAAGVDVLVTASALFGADDRRAVIDQLRASGG